MPSVAKAATFTTDVSALGKKLGELEVSDYDAGKILVDDEGVSKEFATATIAANFTKNGIEPGGEDLLKTLAPQGLTFMQVFSYTTDKQQQIFRTSDGGNLFGSFSDPPQGGYVTADGQRQDFNGDKTPWYSNLFPSLVTGDLPPAIPFADGTIAQFHDTPTVPFPDINRFEGLGNLLNGKNGIWSFETALVGVKQQPKDDPNTPQDERLTGTYEVTSLADFTWGLNFQYTGSVGKTTGFTADDYNVTAKPLVFGSVSDTFKGAFDKQGDNADVEWKVKFTQAAPATQQVPEPGSVLGSLAVGTLGLMTMRRKRQQVVSK